MVQELSENDPVPSRASTADLRCVICGYSLRGLATDASCPECGTPVNRSLRGEEPNCASPQWLRLVRMGVAFSLAGHFFHILPSFQFARYVGPSGASVQTGAVMIAYILNVAAAWLITAGEPRLKGQRSSSLHGLLRTGATIQFGLLILSRTGLIAKITPGANAIGLTVTVVGVTVSAIVVTAWYIVLRRLALRRDDAQLARSTRVMMAGLVAYHVISLIFLLTSTLGTIHSVLSAIYYAFFLGQMVVETLYIILLTRSLRDARREGVIRRRTSAKRDLVGPESIMGWIVAASGGMNLLKWAALLVLWTYLCSQHAYFRWMLGSQAIVELSFWSIVVIAVSVLFVTGSIKLTTPRPGGHDIVHGSTFDARATARFCALSTVILALGAAVFTYSDLAYLGVVMVFVCLLVGSFLAWIFSLVIHLKHLAEWFGSDQLARWFNRANKGLLALIAGVVLCFVAIAIGMDDAIVETITATCGVSVFAVMFLLAILLINFRQQLREAAAAASEAD